MQHATTAPRDVGDTSGHADVVAALDRLTARIERLERPLAGVMGVTEQAPALLATVADTVDAAVRDAGARGVDVDERVASLLHLGERKHQEPKPRRCGWRYRDLAAWRLGRPLNCGDRPPLGRQSHRRPSG